VAAAAVAVRAHTSAGKEARNQILSSVKMVKLSEEKIRQHIEKRERMRNATCTTGPLCKEAAPLQGPVVCSNGSCVSSQPPLQSGGGPMAGGHPPGPQRAR
jgi:hypothetical protein